MSVKTAILVDSNLHLTRHEVGGSGEHAWVGSILNEQDAIAKTPVAGCGATDHPQSGVVNLMVLISSLGDRNLVVCKIAHDVIVGFLAHLKLAVFAVVVV